MVKIEQFAVEQWMDDHETIARYNVAETCCASVSIDQLRDISERKQASVLQLSKVLNYGDIRGSPALRSNLARLYSSKLSNPLPAENILTTSGAISANFIVFNTLISAGDHVICHYPTYQQLYSVPASFGAEVDLWRGSPERDWIPDIEELRKLIKPNTKLIVINNPNNPTGAVLKRSLIQQVVDLAREHDVTVMSDEVYRPLFHSISPADPEFPPSIMSMNYEKVVATGSLSKAYSLAGIRVGWIASRDRSLIEACADRRHYTTISVSQLDEQVAAFALDQDTVHNLLGRNIELAKTNLELLDRFMIKHEDECSWTRPLAGTTAFIKFFYDGKPVDAAKLCQMLLDETGVLLVPGDRCFGEDFKGFVRFGYVCETDVLKEALQKISLFLKQRLQSVPLVA